MGPVDVLLRYPLFALLERDGLQELVDSSETLSLRTGQTLWDEDDRGRWLCVLQQGRVRITRRTSTGEERTLGVLDQGTAFGEYALLPPHRAAASCRAAGEGAALLVPLGLLESRLLLISGVHSHLKNWLRLHALVHHLRHSVGLGFLTAPSLIPLLARCQELHFTAAHVLQADGLLSDGWLFLQSGEVAVHPDDDAPPVLLGPGDCLGEKALLGRRHLATAVALTDTSCLYLPRDLFIEPLDGGNPHDEQTTLGIPTARRTTRSWEFFPQRTSRDCGVAALAMALRGQGLDATVEKLASVVSIGPLGANLSTLTQAAGQFGVQATAVRIGLDQIRHVRLPAVAHLSHGHYAAVFELRGSTVVLGDPFEGVCELSLEAFRERWSGSLLLLTRL